MLVFEFGWVWGNKWYTLQVSVTCVQKHLNLWNHTQSNQIACEILNYNSHTFLRRIIKCIYFERAKLVQNKHWFSVTRLYSALSYIDTIACQYSWPEKYMHSEDVINDRNQISTLSSTWFKRVWSSINNIEHSCRMLYIASIEYVSLSSSHDIWNSAPISLAYQMKCRFQDVSQKYLNSISTRFCLLEKLIIFILNMVRFA